MKPYQEIECNARLLEEVAAETGLTLASVDSMIAHYGRFTSNVIRSGGMEGIFFPYLGKIHVKHESQQYKAFLHSLPANMKQMYIQNVGKAFNKNKHEDDEAF